MAIYLAFLTLALLLQNPFRLAAGGEQHARVWFHAYLAPWSHFICFFPLGFLFPTAQWHLTRWQLLTLLLVYAVGTEVLQGFIPHRNPEWQDLVQDIGGLLAGALLYKLATWARLLPVPKPSNSAT